MAALDGDLDLDHPSFFSSYDFDFGEEEVGLEPEGPPLAAPDLAAAPAVAVAAVAAAHATSMSAACALEQAAVSPAGGSTAPESSSPALPWLADFSRFEDALLSSAVPQQRGQVSAPYRQVKARAPLGQVKASHAEPPAPNPACGVALHIPADGGPKPATSGSAASGPKMADKRTCRLANARSFTAALDEHRAAASAPSSSADDSAHDAASSAVSVYVRKRPLLPRELTRGDFDAVSADAGRGTLTAHACLMRPDLVRMYIRHTTFALDGAFDEAADPAAIYATVAAPLVSHAVEGGRATLFMYGPTGSGKTYTMGETHAALGSQLFGPNLAGTSELGAARGFHVDVSLAEVSGKRCVDLTAREECALLAPRGDRGPLQLRRPGGDGLAATRVRTAGQLSAALRKGLASRATESTRSNDASSRSHAIVVIETPRGGKLTMVDCAGSEWSADSAAHCAKRRREGAEINASLHALKQCVRLFGERERTGKRSLHVPFRDSTLTRLLADSFDGACRLCVLGCVSPASTDVEHTSATMRTVIELADKADGVTNATQPVRRIKS